MQITNTFKPLPNTPLNPRYDVVFKAIFTQSTPESRGALKSFLEAAIDKEITDVEVSVVPNEPAIDFYGERGVQYDINCVFSDGTAAEVELQGFDRGYDYGARAEYMAARLATTYLQRGDKWKDVRKIYQISVLNFSYDKTNTNAIHRYRFLDENDKSGLAGILNIIFLELPKLKYDENALATLSKFEKWGIFFKDADKPKKAHVIAKLLDSEEGIMQANVTYRKLTGDELLQELAWKTMLAEIDYNSSMGAAEERGMQKEKIATARNLLADNAGTFEQIAKWSGLPLAEVMQMAQETIHN